MLDLADLGPLIGGSNRSRYKPTPKDESLLLPNRELKFDALDKLDAHVQVRAQQVVRVADWPFDNFRADFRLEGSADPARPDRVRHGERKARPGAWSSMRALNPSKRRARRA